ncbi:MAG TPA: hypothetical protein VG963_30260, partial [Polyangiaceae bacterium]|nr:hypothetical protein [Polyangiaceae bacterium]
MFAAWASACSSSDLGDQVGQDSGLPFGVDPSELPCTDNESVKLGSIVQGMNSVVAAKVIAAE